jgi:hypothetical protein
LRGDVTKRTGLKTGHYTRRKTQEPAGCRRYKGKTTQEGGVRVHAAQGKKPPLQDVFLSGGVGFGGGRRWVFVELAGRHAFVGSGYFFFAELLGFG